ncbi:MAG: hypothetical protein V1778_00340 [bacterium]
MQDPDIESRRHRAQSMRRYAKIVGSWFLALGGPVFFGVGLAGIVQLIRAKNMACSLACIPLLVGMIVGAFAAVCAYQAAYHWLVRHKSERRADRSAKR